LKHTYTLIASLALAAATFGVTARVDASTPDPNVPGNPGFKDAGVVASVSQLPIATQRAIAAQGLWRPVGFGKSSLVQDPAWVARKEAHLIAVPAQGTSAVVLKRGNRAMILGRLGRLVQPNAIPMYGIAPSGNPLGDQITSGIVEPLGSMPDGSPAKDDAGHSYTDANYWGYCGPGSSNVALWYWNHFANGYPAGSYNDGVVNTYWTSNAPYRSYLMYLAQQVNPPSYKTPGEITYKSDGSNDGTYPTDLRDALNFEASGRSTGTGWSTYFYDLVKNNDVNSTPTQEAADEKTFHQDVASDISQGAPVVVEADTYYLPEWPYTHILHWITVIGYDDNAKTYTYTDTCGKACGSSQDGGLNTIDQHRLFSLAMNDQFMGNGNGGYIW